MRMQAAKKMFAALQACQVPVTCGMYQIISHVGFATEWPGTSQRYACAMQDNSGLRDV